jgi:chemotaxis protein CheX
MDPAITAEPERVRIHLSARAAGPGAEEAGKAGDAPQPVAHNDWHNELAQAAREVFDIMVGASLTAPSEPLPAFVPDFAAMVGIAGTLCGLVSLRTTSECARGIAAKMLGDDELGAAEAAQDAFGEVCNMIAGSFKGRVTGLADGCALSVPTVIFGRDFTLFSLARGEHFEVTFSFEGKLLSVSLDLHG